MFLNITNYIIHIILIGSVLLMAGVMWVVICTASVSVTGRRKVHLKHRRLVWEVFWLAVAASWWSLIAHKITIWKAIVMHVSIGKFLLICMDFIHFWATEMNKSISSSYLTSEDVATLSGCSLLLLAWDGVWPSEIFSVTSHIHIVNVIHNKFFSVSSVDCSDSATLASYHTTWSRCNLALGCNRWDLIIILIWHVLLYWMKHWHIVLLVVWVLYVVHHEVCACGST